MQETSKKGNVRRNRVLDSAAINCHSGRKSAEIYNNWTTRTKIKRWKISSKHVMIILRLTICTNVTFLQVREARPTQVLGFGKYKRLSRSFKKTK